MTDFHVITPEADELVMQVIDGKLIITPPATAHQPSDFSANDLPIDSTGG